MNGFEWYMKNQSNQIIIAIIYQIICIAENKSQQMVKQATEI